MPNPNGINAFDKFGKEPAYGEVKRLADLASAAPSMNNPTHALNAPKRLQRQATRNGDGPAPRQRATVGAAVPTPPAQPSQGEAAVQFWATVASWPEAAPILEYLKEQGAA